MITERDLNNNMRFGKLARDIFGWRLFIRNTIREVHSNLDNSNLEGDKLLRFRLNEFFEWRRFENRKFDIQNLPTKVNNFPTRKPRIFPSFLPSNEWFYRKFFCIILRYLYLSKLPKLISFLIFNPLSAASITPGFPQRVLTFFFS